MVWKPSWKAAAKKFLPHTFQNRVELISETPRILISRDAYEDMYVIVDEVDKEVGWLCSVERIGNDFLIKEVFLLEQESHSSTCEITADGLAQFASQILSEREDGLEVVNSLRCWCHSHCNMGTSPSGQDESQMAVFVENGCSYFIRGILNKQGRMEFTLFLYDIGIKITDVAWELYEPTDESRREKWKAEIAEKVKEKYVLPPASHHVGFTAGYRNWEDDYAGIIGGFHSRSCSRSRRSRKKGGKK